MGLSPGEMVALARGTKNEKGRSGKRWHRSKKYMRGVSREARVLSKSMENVNRWKGLMNDQHVVNAKRRNE